MYLVISLAVADMFVGGERIYQILSLGKDCNFWTIKLYKIVTVHTFSIYFFPAASLTNLAVISWERMHATFRPFKHRLIKKKIFGAAVVTVWFTAGLFTAIVLSPFLFDISWSHVNGAYFSFLLFCLFNILVCYTAIATKLCCGTHPRRHGAMRRDKKLTKTLFIVTVVSSILVLPRIVFWVHFYFPLGGKFDTISYQARLHLKYSVTCLFCANSFINPVVYVFKMPEFKRALFLLFCCRYDSERVQVFPLNDI